MREATGKAHGKIILIGEHSVVHGYPAIAFPFQAVEITVRLEEIKSNSYINSALYQGPVQDVPDDLKSLCALYNKLRTDFNMLDSHWSITVTSNIPAERGMGSSAAVASAFVRSFFAVIDTELKARVLLHYVDYAEKINHGNPSGLDARIISLNRSLSYQRDLPMQEFQFETPYWLVIADTGISGNTKGAVSAVQEGLSSQHITRQSAIKHTLKKLGSLAKSMHQLLSQADQSQEVFEKLATVINDAHEQLRILQVSSPELDYGVHFCLKNGAVAAKLTGGGRGGCYYALVDKKEKAESLAKQLVKEHLAVQTWLVPFASN